MDIFWTNQKSKVIPIKQTFSAPIHPTCLKHSTKNCQLYCEDCIIPICAQCASSKEHRCHRFVNLLLCVECKKEISKKDLQELESTILIKHKDFASRSRNQKANLDKTLEELKTAIDKHGERLHRQISDVVEKFKSKVVKKHEEKSAAITKKEEKVALTISDTETCILGVKELQTSRDLGLVLEYKSRNEEFRDPPPKVNVSLPTFDANEIKNDKIYKLSGSLTMESDEINIIEQGVKSKSRTAEPFISPTTDEQEVVKHCELYN